MNTQAPQLGQYRPTSRRQYRPPPNKITPAEAFKRGFYGGMGLWCSFMVLNIIAGAIVLIVLMALGVLSAALPH